LSTRVTKRLGRLDELVGVDEPEDPHAATVSPRPTAAATLRILEVLMAGTLPCAP
jgi:hypothetical protein